MTDILEEAAFRAWAGQHGYRAENTLVRNTWTKMTLAEHEMWARTASVVLEFAAEIAREEAENCHCEANQPKNADAKLSAEAAWRMCTSTARLIANKLTNGSHV